MRILYGAFADELVVRFGTDLHSEAIVAPISTPQYDYAGLVVAGDTGMVIGIYVYLLMAFAVQRHPAWRTVAAPNPPPDVASRIVNDIKALYNRYGIEPADSDRV